MKKCIQVTLALTCALSLGVGLAGCGCSSNNQSGTSAGQKEREKTEQTETQTTDQKAEEPKEEAPETTTTSGEELSFSFTNGTGFDIDALSLKAADSATYADDHTYDIEDVADGAMGNVTFAQIIEDGNPVELYDILLTTTDGGYIEIFDVNPLSSEDLVFRFEDGIGYIEYRSDEEVVNTKEEAEQSIVENTESTATYDQQSQLG